ncbi:MAG TPA: FAD-dependent oxidoreductase [Syntrophorhabdaceae bacterium]|nr:FAD-dependent oxidoreductase [Syntrophorhabdaceae bacterium]
MKSRATSKNNMVVTDIVVIGGGGGLATAVAAAEAGAKVTLLEKRKLVGGNTALARGLMAAESPVQRRMKIDAHAEDIFKTAMAYSHWKVNPEIIRTFINKSGDTVAWLEEMGVRFEDVRNFYHNQVPQLYHVPEGYGAGLVKALTARCKELGVLILSRTAAKRIMRGKDGIQGVVAVTGGKEMRICADSVVIATGGYSGNKEMLKKYCPEYTEDALVNGIQHMGDGIRMAIEAGAATEDLGNILFMGPFFKGSLQVSVVSVESNTVWVNRKGERFIDESTYLPAESANALNRQPDKISFTLFDEAIKQSFIKDGLMKGVHRLFPPGSKMAEFDKHLRKEAKEGQVKIAHSWKEIAGWIGAEAHVLEKNVIAYNKSCDRGYDDLFYKNRRYLKPLSTPPYYAIRCHQAFHGTIGGIKVNQNMEVLDRRDHPISGLFATGNDAGGWQSDTYCYVLSGMALAFAVNSARIAGENAARCISNRQDRPDASQGRLPRSD